MYELKFIFRLSPLPAEDLNPRLDCGVFFVRRSVKYPLKNKENTYRIGGFIVTNTIKKVRKKLNNYIYDIRVFLIIFALFLITYVWVTTFLQLQDARTTTLSIAQQNAVNFARTFQEHSEKTFESADQAVLFIGDKYLNLGKSFDIPRYLKDGIILGDIFNLVSIVDEHGDLVLSTQPFTRINLMDREHVKVHLTQNKHQLYISKPVLGRVSGKWSMQLTRRINHADGSFAGVVIVSMDPFYFTRLYRDIGLGKRGVITLLGDDGIVRARFTAGERMDTGQDVTKGKLFSYIKQSKNGVALSESIIDGVPRLYAYRSLEHYPLSVSVGFDVEEILEPYYENRRQSYQLAALTTLVILVFSSLILFFVRRLIQSHEAAISANIVKSQLLADLDSQQQALRDSTESLDAILQNAADAIITIGELNQIESFNNAAELIFKYNREEVLGRSIYCLLPGEEHIHFDKIRESVLVETQAQLESVGFSHDMTEFPMELSLSAVSLRGKNKLIAVIRDITERKKIEKMQKEFIANVSHELRTPLTSIRGALGLLRGGAVGAVTSQASQLIHMAYNSSERLTILINDLLDLQKIDAGKLEFNCTKHSLMFLLHDTIKVSLPFANMFNVQLILKEPLPLVFVNVDPNRWQQIMANLISNACKYSPPHGNVIVSAELVNATRIRVEVCDQGEGVPAEFRSRIFQRFAQADSSDTKVQKGTGLGLSIAKKLIEAMNGSIDYRSEWGNGSTFYVELPIIR